MSAALPDTRTRFAVLLTAVTLCCAATAYAEEEGNFRQEADRIWQAASPACANHKAILPADEFSGSMLRCQAGSASLVVIAARPPEPENLHTIRVEWNDVYNRGAGKARLHADRGEALFLARVATLRYVPEISDEVVAAFAENEPRSWTVGPLSVTFSYFRATISDERILTISPAQPAETEPVDEIDLILGLSP